MSQIHFEWQFNKTINEYASCLDDKEANFLVQTMVHSNLIVPVVSLICKYAGVAYEGKYNLLSGPKPFPRHGKVIEEMMYKSYQDHTMNKHTRAHSRVGASARKMSIPRWPTTVLLSLLCLPGSL